MESYRKAIWQALDKGDPEDRAFREQVYRRAFEALDRSMRARGDLPAGQLRARREAVKAVVVEIEREFQPARPARPQGPVPRSSRPGSANSRAPALDDAFAGELRIDPDDRLSVPPRAAAARGFDEEDGYYDDERPRRRSFALLFVLATAVAAIGMGAWWVLQNGILAPAGPEIEGFPRQAAQEAEDFDPSAEDPAGTEPAALRAGGDWLTVFSPTDPTTVRATTTASVETIDGEDGPLLRIAAEAPEAAVTFDIGPGVLERLAGRRAIFSLTARAEEGSESEISIACDFGGLGSCGRRRFVVGPSTMEYLFEAELAAGRPSGPGTITIAPDFAGRGHLLDILSLRVSAGG